MMFLLYKKEKSVKIKEDSSSHLYHSAMDLARTALSDRSTRPNLPTAESLQRKANRHRKSQRPSEPTDLFLQ
ncbi:hypothetical protein DPMN_017694 [Dreissena polymorpha]|uniref:Uncharacterized protein n=1 Tax=Dreissena polymorpha TaxID=45954 RepID=A0A9D4NFV4_DREPO|nr:hypothetical protein DPMN_017694 [Dreissena polymorpha]